MVLRTAMPATQPPPAQQQGQKAAASLSPFHWWFGPLRVTRCPLPLPVARTEQVASMGQEVLGGVPCACDIDDGLMLGSCSTAAWLAASVWPASCHWQLRLCWLTRPLSITSQPLPGQMVKDGLAW